MEEHAKYNIQLHLGNLSMKFQGKKIETNALSMYTQLNFANLALDLIQDIAKLIATKSMVKFVPTSLKYNKMIKDNTEHYENLLREQNTYLVHYTDVWIGGLTEDMLDHKVTSATVKDNILMSQFIVDLHETAITINKGIWTIESTGEDLHKALDDVETSLLVLPENRFHPMYPL
eukprot:13013153-Ditylum_brightwellii.AAC.1